MIPPHITVTYPPLVPEAEWLLIRPALAETLRAFPPFDVTLRRLGTFAVDEYVLWLQPDDGTLELLHSTLHVRFPDYVPLGRYAYIPHLTIAFFESEAAMLVAQDALAGQIRPLHFRVDEVTYVVLGANGHWHARENLPLG